MKAFRLGAIALLGLLMGQPAGANGPSWAEKSEKEAIAHLRGVTTNLQFHRNGKVRLVRFSKPLVTDENLRPIRAFREIEYIAVVCPQVTDAGIGPLEGLPELDTLLLSGTGVTDAGLKSLSALPQLEQLFLDRTQITDAGLSQLAKLKSLKVLSLAGTSVSEQGLKALTGLTALETLILAETQTTDAVFSQLGRFPQLKFVDLSGCRITGAGLSALPAASSLEHLTLNHTPFDSGHWNNVTRLKSLKHLELYETPIEWDSLKQLQNQRPDLRVFSALSGQGHPTKQPRRDNSVQPADSPPTLKPVQQSIQTRLADRPFAPDFQRHVVPLLGRLGCNGRACHGSFQGQGGFRLSMFGYDFAADWKSLRERIDAQNPEASLILHKPTSAEEHGGGLRLPPGGWEHELLRRWIASGAKGVAQKAPQFVRLDVTPRELVFASAGETRPLKVIAIWSDGSREDVTSLTRFQTNEESIARVSSEGIVTSVGRGDTHIISFYDNGVHATPVLLPVSDQRGERFPKITARTPIDRHINTKLQKLGVIPSEICRDAEFLRRVSLDLIGTLPTPAEVEAFLQDPSTDKREKKIEELLAHPAYVTWWTTQLCDLTGSNAGYLGSTEMAQTTAAQWRAWIQHRVETNVGWDEIVRGIVLAQSRPPGQSYAAFANRSSTYTRRQEPADFAAEQEFLPHYWYRSNISQPMDKALAFGYTFLGVRLQCAQCHKHPFDQWSKQDFEQFTEFFTRIKTGTAPDAQIHHDILMRSLGVPEKLNTAALRRQSYMRIAAEGRPIPWNEVYIAPPGEKPQVAKLLGDRELDLNHYADPRVPLMDWLLADPNRYLAKAFVNRIWANYFHRGIIHPTDDLNLANPPSNGPLLDYLVTGFIEQGYDMKWLHREIVSSEAYQRSWKPNATNQLDERNFSHAWPRRLPAEVAIDAIVQATSNTTQLAKYPKNLALRKIGQHPRSYQARAIDFSLLIFGKPLRTTNCDCERQAEPTLLQSLYLRNDQEVIANLNRADGWLAELEMSKTPLETDAMIRSAYLRTLARYPTAKEQKDCRDHLAAAEDRNAGMQDILWALLNTQEFITNH